MSLKTRKLIQNALDMPSTANGRLWCIVTQTVAEMRVGLHSSPRASIGVRSDPRGYPFIHHRARESLGHCQSSLNDDYR